MKLSREKILRMFDGTGGSSGGGGDIDGYASESWVGSKYLSKDFIAQTINWYDGTDIVIPNDTKSDIDLIEFAVNASFRGDLNVLGNLTMAGRLVATQEWVGRNYVSISFFDAVFQVFNNTTKIAVNGTIPADTSKMNIKAMFGFWTDFYVTALGRGIAQPTVVNVLNDLADVSLGSPLTNGQALVYSSSLGKWTNGEPTAGTVTRIGMTVPSGFTVNPSAITRSGTFAITFANGYSLPTNTKQSNWDAAYTDRHTHSNKTVLDGISTAKVSNWDAAYSKASTLEGYFDANGNAKSALKLTTVNKTAWGQTYWTSGGVPTSISGNMTDVGNITMNGSNRINPNGNSIYIGNSNNAGWVYMADMCSQSGNTYWNIKHNGDADFANLTMAGKLVATQEWVNSNYVSISFFDAVFQVFNNTTKIAVNGTIPADTSKMNIKAMFGFWTDFYVTALGRGIAQPTVVNVLNDLADVSLGSPLTNGQALVYSSSLGKWTNGEPTAGTVTRIGMTVPSGFTVNPSAITSSGTFSITFASGYSLPTNTKQSNWDAAYTDRHTHSNKTVLDGITSTKVSNWDAAYTDRHTHSNKTVLDGITSTKVSNWDAAYTDRHTHSNKTVLDGISTAKVSNWDAAYSKASTLEGYFDANGNAKSALKLTTVNKTAWGQTYWTSGGVPTSISGNMTGVGNITMNGSNRIDPNGNSIYIGNSNNAGWVYMADMCSQSGNTYWNIKHSGNAEFANVYSAGYVTALSDIRYKDVVDRFYLDAETIAQTSVIRFKMKDGDDNRTHAGGIAQEWKKILPEVVVEDERGRLSMDYGTIGMIASVSLAREVRKLKEEIKILRKQLGR